MKAPKLVRIRQQFVRPRVADLANAHLSAAANTLAVPWIEYLVKWNEIHQHFLLHPLKPVNGVITVTDAPGLDMDLDPAKVESEKYLDFSDL